MLVPISKACDVLGVCARALRRWERRGFMTPYRTPGNHRRYDQDALLEFRESCVYNPRPETKTGVAAVYARMSSHKSKRNWKGEPRRRGTMFVLNSSKNFPSS